MYTYYNAIWNYFLSLFVPLDSQWFGVDIGGSLVKCVYFECPCANGSSKEELAGITTMREFIKSNLTYGSSGKNLLCLLCLTKLHIKSVNC